MEMPFAFAAIFRSYLKIALCAVHLCRKMEGKSLFTVYDELKMTYSAVTELLRIHIYCLYQKNRIFWLN